MHATECEKSMVHIGFRFAAGLHGAALSLDFLDMETTVTGVDLWRGIVPLHFENGEAAMFYAGFLYANRNSSGNRVISDRGELAKAWKFPAQELPEINVVGLWQTSFLFRTTKRSCRRAACCWTPKASVSLRL